jgi:hypothetical protein
MNPFRAPDKREMYDRVVRSYRTRSGLAFTPDGSRHTGSSFAANFWAGFDGVENSLYQPSDRGYRESYAYVLYAAGRYCSQNDRPVRDSDHTTPTQRN